MRIVFWNIGPKLTNDKLDRIKTLNFNEIDILCFSEGTKSEKDCIKLEYELSVIGYELYYSPRFPKSRKELQLNYDYNSFGLKIFIKKGLGPIEDLTFTEIREKGRIVYLQFPIGNVKYHLFFIHSSSKLDTDFRKAEFTIELNLFVNSKTRRDTSSNVIIMGDFNSEPWGEDIRQSRYINSFFSSKNFNYQVSRNKIGRIYFNPFHEFVQNNPDKNLIGSYFGNRYISLLDFALLSKEIVKYKARILNKINGIDLLENKSKEISIIDGFDHLPIEIKIN